MPTPDEFMTYWNSKRYLPKIRFFTDTRTKQLKIRSKNEAFEENWREVIDKLNSSKFHTGRQQGYTWKAKPDFILRNDTNWVQVLEIEARSVNRKVVRDDYEQKYREKSRKSWTGYLTDPRVSAQERAGRAQGAIGKGLQWLVDELGIGE